MVPTTISATFAQPDQLTVYVEAKPEGPLAQDVKVEADVTGTWRIDGDSLSVVANEAAVKSSAGKNAATDFLAKQLEGQIKEAVTKSATGKMKWDGPDKLTVTSSDGTMAVLTRVKG